MTLEQRPQKPLLESVIESISFTVPLDPWMSLKALSEYAGLPVRALRDHLTDPTHPLPHFRMKEPHTIKEKGRLRTVTGKILVRKSEFDAWLVAFRHKPDIDLDKMLDEVLEELGLPRSSNRGRQVNGG